MSPGDLARNTNEQYLNQDKFGDNTVLVLATNVKRTGLTGVVVNYTVMSVRTQRIYACHEFDLYDHAYLTLND